MTELPNKESFSQDEQALMNKFLEDHRLFYGPDPEIMNNHSIGPRTAAEEEVFAKPLDVHMLSHVRGLVNAALDESFTMVEQMGSAPGAKWGDLVTAIYTASGDLTIGDRAARHRRLCPPACTTRSSSSSSTGPTTPPWGSA